MTGLWPVAYVGAAKFGLALLGLYLTWSTSVLYDYYEHVPRIWGLSAIEDQNAGGAIMMVEQSLTFVIVLVALFVQMLTRSEAEERRRERLEDAEAATYVSPSKRSLSADSPPSISISPPRGPPAPDATVAL